MARSRAWLIALLGLSAVLAAAAAILWWLAPATPTKGPIRLSAVSFDDLRGWQSDDLRLAIPAFNRSCQVLLHAPSVEAQTYGGSASDWTSACRSIPKSPSKDEARAWFEQTFKPFAVSAGGATDALFTGYYEPELHGSRVRHGRYQTPIYGAPSDLVDVDLGIFRANLRGERIAGRVIGNRLVPYGTRADIDNEGLAHAAVLFFADDPVAVFFLHIQGSGRIVLDDGAVRRLAYADQNGWPYTPVGRVLVEKGELPKQGLSMQVIRAWMVAHPSKANWAMEQDLSYVFFKDAPLGDPSLGSPGAEGVPLAPGRSLAVDRRVHPLGAPFFVVADEPDPNPARPEHPLARLLIAQDIGGAIRGPLRGDVFFGDGPDAESVAGRMKSTGRLYVLLPKVLATRIAGERP